MGVKVLLADDSITIQKVVELILLEQGFELKTVNNGQEAISAMLTFTPDIVLADAEMPLLNGYQLCERIKSNARFSHIPVVLLAGAFEPLDTELAKSVRVDDILTKPFEAKDLLEKINHLLERKGKTPEMEVTAEEEVPVEESLEVEEALPEVEITEEPLKEELTLEEEIPVVEEIIEETRPEVREIKESPREKITSVPVTGITIDTELIRKELEIAINKSVKEAIEKIDIASIMKETIERMLIERVPSIIEEVSKGLLEEGLKSISHEVEKVLWETIPDLAETIITKEIERIKVSLS